MKYFLSTVTILSLTIFYPALAQTRTTGQTLQRFQPNMTIRSNTSGRGFGGVSISGVGASIAGCTNAGGKITNALSDLTGNLFPNKDGGLQNAGRSAGKAVEKAFGIGGISKGTGGVSSVPVNDSSVVTEQKKSNKKESCLDALAYTLAKQSLSQVTNKTLNWVNTGFGGNPFYVRDMDSFLHSIEKETFRTYINTSNQLQNKIIGQSVANNLVSIFTGRSIPSITKSAQNAVEKKYNDFSSDFTKGGWASWLSSTQGDQNPLGQFMKVSEQLGQEYGRQEENTKQELTQGQGFLSQKKCVEYASAPSPDDNYNFNLNNDGSLKCLRYETVTPGSVIADQTKLVTSSGVRQLEAADELNEVLGSFFDQLLNSLFNKGLQALGRSSGDSFGNNLNGFGGVGTNTVTGTNGQPINGVGTGVGLSYLQSGSGFNDATFNISNPRHIAAVLKTQKDFLNQALDSRAALQKIVPLVGRLDYCLPGPNPLWQNGVETNLGEFVDAISAATYTGDTNGTLQIPSYTLSDILKGETQDFGPKAIALTNAPYVRTTTGGGNGFLGGFLQGGLVGGIISGITGGGSSSTTDTSRIGPSLATILATWAEQLQNSFAPFSTQELSTAFSATGQTPVAQAFARGFVRDATAQVRLLPDYIQSTVSVDGEYQAALDQTTVAIDELESIRSEVLDIVTTARNRYIAQKRSQGVTINTACLDQNYDITNRAIEGNPRGEEEATDLLDAVEAARTEFYSTL